MRTAVRLNDDLLVDTAADPLVRPAHLYLRQGPAWWTRENIIRWLTTVGAEAIAPASSPEDRPEIKANFVAFLYQEGVFQDVVEVLEIGKRIGAGQRWLRDWASLDPRQIHSFRPGIKPLF